MEKLNFFVDLIFTRTLTNYSIVKTSDHRLINITDGTLDVVFSRFRGFSFTISLRQKPKGVTRSMLSLSCDSVGPLPQDNCERKTPKF